MQSLRLLRRRFIWQRLKGLWEEAFPPPPDVAQRFHDRMEQSKQQREQMQAGGGDGTTEQETSVSREIVFVREAKTERRRLGRFFIDYLQRKSITGPEYREFLTEWQRLMDSSTELKDRLHTRLMTSDSVVVKNSIRALDAVQQRMYGHVFEKILRKDPAFDMEVFEKEVRLIFERIYSAYLAHDLPYLEKVCSGAALGHFRALITAQQEKGGRPKYAHPLNLSEPLFLAVSLLDNDFPLFAFSIHFQELYCLVDPVSGAVVDGDGRRLTTSDYVFWLMPHESPDVEAVGHDWALVRIELRQSFKQLM